MSLDNYVAFYVAGDCQALKDIFFHFVEDNKLPSYTISYEVSKESHSWCSGSHIHVLAKWSDKNYRAFMAKLKSLDFPMFGRATPDQPRTYGKVKHIRDFHKMLVYTIKGGDYTSTESADLISKCKEISFEKEDITSECREKINKFLDENASLTTDNHHANWSQPHPQGFFYPTDSEYSILSYLKLFVIRYFRKNKDKLKLPSKSKVMYFVQYYLMYHRSDIKDEQILELFY